MPDNEKNSEAEIIIAQNKEQWDRLLFLLKNPEGTSVFWINCDTFRIKKPLHDALHEHLPDFKPYDIHINEKTTSLRALIKQQADQIPPHSIIHVFGMEDATRNLEFVDTLNFQRDSLFRKAPANIIIWADFATGTLLARRAYDFWSWIIFTFDFITPSELLTSRQKGFDGMVRLEDESIPIKGKDSIERIRHLEQEWEKFLTAINNKPSTAKQMNDTITIAMALANEYRDEERYEEAIGILENTLKLNPNEITENNKGLIWNQLGLLYTGKEDYKTAKFFFENAIGTVYNLYGKNSLNAATVLSNIGVLYMETGEFEYAKKNLEEAIKIYSETYSDDHPNKIREETNLGTVYLHLKEYDKAKKLLENAMKYSMKLYGVESPFVAKIGSNLSVAYRETGNLEKAKTLLQKALEIIITNFGDNSLRVAIQYHNLAYLSYDLNDDVNAKYYMQKAHYIFNNTLGESSPKTKDSLAFLKDLEQQSPSPTS